MSLHTNNLGVESMIKEVQMSIKLESELREQFMKTAESLHRTAAQIIRELMRAFVAQQKKPNAETIDVINAVERGEFNTYKSADHLYRKLGI